MQCLLLGFFVAVAGYFVWTVDHVQIMGLWAEIQAFFPITLKL